MSGKARKIGLFGGTFDPVHEGHLALARAAMECCRLDRILFIPAARPPHKGQPVASFDHRVAMLREALAGCRDMDVSLVEAERDTPSYTIDTVREMKRRLAGQELFFVLGADSLVELHLWYRYEELLGLVRFIVAARPSIPFAQVAGAVAGLPGDFVYDARTRVWQRADGARIHYLADVRVEVSSSRVRRLLASGRPAPMVPERVRRYIETHHLYRRPGGGSAERSGIQEENKKSPSM